MRADTTMVELVEVDDTGHAIAVAVVARDRRVARAKRDWPIRRLGRLRRSISRR